MNIQTKAIIRDRNQMTIPSEAVREHDWIKPNSVIHVIIKSEEIVLKPYKGAVKEKKVDWKKVRKAIREARVLSAGGKKVSLSKFIVRDRERHRI